MSLESLQTKLASVRGKTLNAAELGAPAVEVAAELLRLARRKLRPRDRMRARKLTRMISDPSGKMLTMQMADEVFRSRSTRRCGRRFRQLIRAYGLPRYLPFWERSLMAAGRLGSALVPALVMPMISRRMRSESSAVILPSERHQLNPYLEKRRRKGVEINLNQLGEAVLGEEEAARRLDTIIGRLRSPEVDYISVKLSAIHSQISLIAFEHSVALAKERLVKIFRAARESPYLDAEGRARPKFVNLDMEEYRDLQLTAEAFKEVLTEPEFLDIEAGIVLQAYLPDSAAVQEDITAWAISRKRRGGSGIKLRLVKGANLAMESVEAELHGWAQAPFDSKLDVDANYKQMILYGMRPENAAAVRLGIGSHNLFDVAFAMLCAEMHGTSGRVEFEMLEGMANHQAASVADASAGMRMYAPVVRHGDFHSALAYLVRRLDENTSEENYLSRAFGLKVGSDGWKTESERFRNSCARAGELSNKPRRQQNRASEEITPDESGARFENAPNTDWSVPGNRAWLARYLEKWQKLAPSRIAPQIDGLSGGSGEEIIVHDPSRPGHVAYRYLNASLEEVDRALEIATRAFPEWNLKPFDERSRLLKSAASIFARERGDTIGTLALDGAKAVAEADTEISEAIDFANFYARSLGTVGLSECEASGRGVVVVTPPWNFPYAIPAGGVLAALMAGNTVILKPAPQAVMTGARLARQLWSAGVPDDVLQFVPTADDEVGRALVTDRRVDTVVLTGSHETAKLFQRWRPRIRLLAETSGKNAMVITAAADIDAAVSDLVYSAFGHSGQKCSAASLALVERELYERLDFRRQLRDAAQSLQVDSAWDPASIVTPLIAPPGPDLAKAQSYLEEGEEWLLEPQRVDGNPCLWSPGIKLGVTPQSSFFNTECFGPVLGIMAVKNLDEAIKIQNSSKFGLTGGLHSLDPEEISRWVERVEVGNAYVNRSMTGAIVRRQPFGGWGHSVFGPGAKAGGPDYMLQFASWQQSALPDLRESPGDIANEFLREIRKRLISHHDREEVGVAAWNYGWAYRQIFSVEHDPSMLQSERNVLRYRPRHKMMYRISGEGSARMATLALLAAAITGIELDLSIGKSIRMEDLEPSKLIPNVKISQEGDSEFVERLKALDADQQPELIRAPKAPLRELFETANAFHAPVIIDPMLANGRLELRNWFREQSISETTHRYGNLLGRFRDREGEPDKNDDERKNK